MYIIVFEILNVNTKIVLNSELLLKTQIVYCKKYFVSNNYLHINLHFEFVKI